MKTRASDARRILFALAFAADDLAIHDDEIRDAKKEIDWSLCEHLKHGIEEAHSNGPETVECDGTHPCFRMFERDDFCAACKWNHEVHQDLVAARRKRSHIIRRIATLGRELREFTPFPEVTP